jgi:hypothetical protein
MIRNLSLSLALAACAFIGNAYADDITNDPFPFVSTRTRAEVQAEMKEFRASGVNPWADDYNQLAQFRGEKSRAEVTAEYMKERDRVAAFNGEDSGSMYLARAPHEDRSIQLAGQPIEAQ